MASSLGESPRAEDASWFEESPRDVEARGGKQRSGEPSEVGGGGRRPREAIPLGGTASRGERRSRDGWEIRGGERRSRKARGKQVRKGAFGSSGSTQRLEESPRGLPLRKSTGLRDNSAVVRLRGRRCNTSGHDGLLGSRLDEGRREMRYAMRIAGSRESFVLPTHMRSRRESRARRRVIRCRPRASPPRGSTPSSVSLHDGSPSRCASPRRATSHPREVVPDAGEETRRS